LWATAAETAFGSPEGTFVAAYTPNRESANELALDASVVARPLLDLLEAKGEWSGSSVELLKMLGERVDDQTRKFPGWPKNARGLIGQLKRLGPNLRAAGWVMEQDRSSKKRSWTIHRLTNDTTRNGSSPHASPLPSRNGTDATCEPMQSDADWLRAREHDTNDAYDANPGEPWNPDRY